MKLSFLEKLLVWLAKLAQIVAIVKSEPTQQERMQIFAISGNYRSLAIETRARDENPNTGIPPAER
jgi:hypothetical protein